MPLLTDSGTLVRLAYQGLRNLGVDADEVLKRAKLPPESLYEANLRTAFSAQPLFWQAAVELSGDPAIGLHLGEHSPVYRGQILEYLMLSSDTFGDGIQRITKYQRLISDALHCNLVVGDSACLVNQFAQPQYATSHLAEAMVQGLINLFKSVTDNNFHPQSIAFRHRPNTSPEEYQRIFNCPVEFDAANFRLEFDPDILNYRSLHAEPELLNMQLQVADRSIALLDQQEMVADVRRQIAALLENEEPTLQTVACRIGTSERQLRHQLNSAGTSFQRILNDYRKDLACRLLSQTSEAISEIVYLTGFSEPSTFYRAFKRWQGITPVEYRQQFSTA